MQKILIIASSKWFFFPFWLRNNHSSAALVVCVPSIRWLTRPFPSCPLHALNIFFFTSVIDFLLLLLIIFSLFLSSIMPWESAWLDIHNLPPLLSAPAKKDVCPLQLFFSSFLRWSPLPCLERSLYVLAIRLLLRLLLPSTPKNTLLVYLGVLNTNTLK